MSDYCIDRRNFLKISGGVAAGFIGSAAAPAIALASDSQSYEQIPVLPEYKPRVAGSWIPKGRHESCYDLFRQMVEQVTDFSWLSSGDKVMIKPSLDSGYKYPTTTDPWGVRCMIRLLREKGAGDVLVGEQSGTEYVVMAKSYHRGSSRELCEKAGLLDPIIDEGATPVFFEEYGYDGYTGCYPSGDHHWEYPVYVPTVLDEIDHLIYMPRVGAHLLGDITAGMKVCVGFLRNDSRVHFHQGGDNIFAMFQEINDVDKIKSKFRLCVTSATKVLSTMGPDFGYVTQPEHGLIFASDDLLAHDLLAYAWLQWNRKFQTPRGALAASYFAAAHSSFINRSYLLFALGVENLKSHTPDIPVCIPANIYDNPALRNFMIRKGGRPEQIIWDQLNQNPDISVEAFIDGLINPKAA